jgi:hypothetical protein
MATRRLLTKPHGDTPVEPARREGPTKPHGDTPFEPTRRKGPTKGEHAPATKRIKSRRMLKAPVEAAVKRPTAKKAATKADGPPGLGDQQPARKRARTPERYVRIRVRVDDGVLSIVASHPVEGPLAQTTTFEGGYAYEVTDGDHLLHAGSIPELGIVRSFAHPSGTLEQQRHHTYQLSTYEFNARVPSEALKRAALSNIAIVLYRVKERPPMRAAFGQPLAAEPLGLQRAREIREVGRVVGLPASVLSPATREPRPTTQRRAKKRRPKKKRR